jgi:hypothetical protein
VGFPIAFVIFFNGLRVVDRFLPAGLAVQRCFMDILAGLFGIF